MTITHHPTDPTLAAFAAGTLDEGQRLVVAVHLSGCASCRNGVRSFEHVGGVLLEGIEPAAMASGALALALERLEVAGSQAANETPHDAPAAGELPDLLSRYPQGDWRWMGRGVHWRSVTDPAIPGSRVFMLKVQPGIRLPHHKHTGIEWTCVLQGAFRHAYGRYGAGDFDEADESFEHVPVVEEGVACVCLVAMQGQLRLQGWSGRLLQPFVRF